MNKTCHCSICFKLWNWLVLVALPLEIIINKYNRIIIKLKKCFESVILCHFRTFEKYIIFILFPFFFFLHSKLTEFFKCLYQIWDKSNIMLRLLDAKYVNANGILVFSTHIAWCSFRYNILSSFSVSEKVFFFFLVSFSLFAGQIYKE